jgi:L-lactate dehydrogenase (cytochrome)
MNTVKKVKVEITDVEKARLERASRVPPLSEILNLHDFEVPDSVSFYSLS